MMKKRGGLYNNRETSVISMAERSSYEIKDRGDKKRTRRNKKERNLTFTLFYYITVDYYL